MRRTALIKNVRTTGDIKTSLAAMVEPNSRRVARLRRTEQPPWVREPVMRRFYVAISYGSARKISGAERCPGANSGPAFTNHWSVVPITCLKTRCEDLAARCSMKTSWKRPVNASRPRLCRREIVPRDTGIVECRSTGGRAKRRARWGGIQQNNREG